ncbi:hypothetical protein SAMN04488023_12340 [Pedobacter rhizosphaerae]|uniref:Uncharacterized protein n=1 Tax=Pedobacter rhizosphaerae TaxID=390241 RepID=A0A1H9TK36_9SPHI|nr:hypothetical protein SAMN04488023_12340 [Pedobacter rhizosphaerae]
MLISFRGFTFVRKWFVFVQIKDICNLFPQSLKFATETSLKEFGFALAIILPLLYELRYWPPPYEDIGQILPIPFLV